LRDGKEQDVPLQDLVPGDIVKLEAGSLVPADGRLLAEDDLHVRESALTGESLPVEKDAGDLPPGHHDISGAQNSVFLGTAVQSGLATMVVVHTGAATVFGGIAGRLAQREPETEFDHGIKHFGYLIMRVILLLVLFVFLINVAFKRPLLDSPLCRGSGCGPHSRTPTSDYDCYPGPGRQANVIQKGHSKATGIH
jgi:Mg2+-importing ATPase